MDIAGLTRPIAPLTLRYGYRAYNFVNDDQRNQALRTAFADNQNLLAAEQYSYFRQGVNLGADYRVNDKVAFNVGYNWKGVTRTDSQGRTSSHSPQAGIRLVPTNWLSLTANYTFESRDGSMLLAFVRQPEEGDILIPLTYKFFVPQPEPIQCHCRSGTREYCHRLSKFLIYNDNFTNSTFGIQSDRGWSGGVDVGWRPHDRVALVLDTTTSNSKLKHWPPTTSQLRRLV